MLPSDWESPVLVAPLLPPHLSDSPKRVAVSDVSTGAARLLGVEKDDLLNKDLIEVLTFGASPTTVSRSACKDVQDFCTECQRSDIEQAGEAVSIQYITDAQGQQALVLSLVGLCRLGHHTALVVVAQERLGLGFPVRVSNIARNEAIERCRSVLESVVKFIKVDDADNTEGVEASSPGRRPFKFYSERLQSHSLLSQLGMHARRREAKELQNGCMLFSDRPLAINMKGLSFSIRVEDVTQDFDALPLLGFTRREPQNNSDLYPEVSTLMGDSILIGTGNQAYARDKPEHRKMSFKLPSQDEVQTWKSTRPWAGSSLRVGDILQCTYSHSGSIELRLNGHSMLAFDTGRPIDVTQKYWAVLDVCFSVVAVSLLPCGCCSEYVEDPPSCVETSVGDTGSQVDEMAELQDDTWTSSARRSSSDQVGNCATFPTFLEEGQQPSLLAMTPANGVGATTPATSFSESDTPDMQLIRSSSYCASAVTRTSAASSSNSSPSPTPSPKLASRISAREQQVTAGKSDVASAGGGGGARTTAKGAAAGGGKAATTATTTADSSARAVLDEVQSSPSSSKEWSCRSDQELQSERAIRCYSERENKLLPPPHLGATRHNIVVDEVADHGHTSLPAGPSISTNTGASASEAESSCSCSSPFSASFCAAAVAATAAAAATAAVVIRGRRHSTLSL